MTYKEFQEHAKAVLAQKIPMSMLSSRPGAGNLTSIKSIYITDQLNELFGIGKWQIKTQLEPINGNTFIKSVKGSTEFYTVMVHVTLLVPELNVLYECVASADNTDLGDAAKGAISDCISKIGSWMGIAGDVYRGKIKIEELTPTHAEWKTLKEKFQKGEITLEEIKEAFNISSANEKIFTR